MEDSFDEIRYRGIHSKLFASCFKRSLFSYTFLLPQAANKVDISVGGTKSEIISQASDPLLLGRQQTP